MRLTERDTKLLKDIALSHVLSRDHLIELGYFSSVTRVNTRLRGLLKSRLIRRIETPFFGQGLYVVTAKAADLLGERVAPLVLHRSPSPRFLQHALSVTNARLLLKRKGADLWRFEQQLRTEFEVSGKTFEIRPDGMAIMAGDLIAVEVDLGHVTPSKFRQKLVAYQAFVTSGECGRQWRASTFRLLTLTTGKRRVAKLKSLLPHDCPYDYQCFTFADSGIPSVGGWS